MLYPLSYGGWTQSAVKLSLGAARQVNSTRLLVQ